MTPPEIRVDREHGQTLVGIEGEDVRVSASISSEADPEDAEAVVRDLWREVRHSAGDPR